MPRDMATVSTMRLDEQAWPDVDLMHPVLCVPVGSCEQHGPHLPLGTDTIIAVALADELAARRADVLVAPALAMTASGEHAGFAGTVSIGTDVTAATVIELARSADWADGVILVNGHGGNREAIDRAVATLRAEGRDVLAWWPTADMADAHAGRAETSMMLALRPDLVRVERAVSGETAPVAALMGQLRAGGVVAVSPNGVLGNPAGATAAEGASLVREMAEDLALAVDGWRSARAGR
jgi:mycofactocin system creatininase family protein